MTKPKIGFIGLGLMGGAMVQRLLDQGYDLTVLGNRDRTELDKAIKRGASEAKTAKDLAAVSEVIILCMGTSDHVESRMYGDDGALAGAKPGTLIIDTGTSLPGSTLKIGADAAAKAVRYMDAPLGRTPAHALDGQLNIMAAGADADFARAKPILDDLGENVFHVGPLGAGHTLKLINNFYGMTTAVAMSEAFAMADLAGLKRETLYEVMSAGPLRSGMMDFIKAQAVDGEQKLEFSISNAGKDVGYYSKMADELGVPSLMSGAAKTSLGMAKAQGFGDKMVSEMVDYFAKLFSKA